MIDNKLVPAGLGSLVIVLNLDSDKMDIQFTNPNSARLVHPQELPLLFSPMIAALIMNLIKTRSKSIITLD
jgi:hypothetical protein